MGCKLCSSLNIIKSEKPSSSTGQFFPFQMELFSLLFSNFCFCFNSMSSRAALCMCTSEEMCNEEVFIFFSAAWFLLPLVMLLAFYKHFFPPFRSSNFAPAMAFQRYIEWMWISNIAFFMCPTHIVWIKKEDWSEQRWFGGEVSSVKKYL